MSYLNTLADEACGHYRRKTGLHYQRVRDAERLHFMDAANSFDFLLETGDVWQEPVSASQPQSMVSLPGFKHLWRQWLRLQKALRLYCSTALALRASYLEQIQSPNSKLPCSSYNWTEKTHISNTSKGSVNGQVCRVGNVITGARWKRGTRFPPL